MTFLATLPAGRLAGAREIAEIENIPVQFLWKVLQNLARQGLIRSFKGVRGGYELARPADEVTLMTIVGAVDNTVRFGDCVLGLKECSEENACPLHHRWRELRGNVSAMLEESTLKDLARVAMQTARKSKK